MGSHGWLGGSKLGAYVLLAWIVVDVVEAAVAVAAGVMAGSISLLAFGPDSLIELISAGVLIWRLTV
jgi:hypothetical protein